MLKEKNIIIRSAFLLRCQKANHFLNKSAAENPLHKELIRNDKLSTSFLLKCTNIKGSKAPFNSSLKSF